MTRTVGRPHLDGSAAGTAPRLDKITITISAADAELLRYIGGGERGNVSAGVRYLVAEYSKAQAAGQLVSPAEAERYLNAMRKSQP